MTSYFKLIRIWNLIFIGFIQIAMYQMVIIPILRTYGFDNDLYTNMLYLLITATVLIAAGGYVLNDYFDVKIDAINRPESQIVGNLITRNKAMVIHQVLTGLGVACGLLLAYFSRSFTLAFIFIVVPGLLWFYSASYKRQFLTGNLVVAFIAALTVLVVGIFQLAFLEKEYGKLIFETPIPGNFYGWIGGFALFSFLTTLIREIIKDMQDEKGDREMECRTMPIKWGIANTKLFLYGLIVLTVSGLYLLSKYYILYPGTLTFNYITYGVALPFAALIYLLVFAKTSTDYNQASTLSKVIMLVGVLYSVVFYFLQAKTHGFTIFNLFIIR